MSHHSTETRGLAGNLRESVTWLRTIFEQAAVGVALVETPTARFARVNRRFCDIVGYTLGEMKQTSFHEITHPDDIDVDLTWVERLVAGEIKQFTREKWNGRLPGLEAGGGGLRWTLTGRRHQSAQVEE